MPNYRVTYEERIIREIVIEAESPREARDITQSGDVTNCDEDKVVSEEHCNIINVELIL